MGLFDDLLADRLGVVAPEPEPEVAPPSFWETFGTGPAVPTAESWEATPTFEDSFLAPEWTAQAWEQNTADPIMQPAPAPEMSWSESHGFGAIDQFLAQGQPFPPELRDQLVALYGARFREDALAMSDHELWSTLVANFQRQERGPSDFVKLHSVAMALAPSLFLPGLGTVAGTVGTAAGGAALGGHTAFMTDEDPLKAALTGGALAALPGMFGDAPVADAADNIYDPGALSPTMPGFDVTELEGLELPPIDVPASPFDALPPVTDAADNILDPSALPSLPGFDISVLDGLELPPVDVPAEAAAGGMLPSLPPELELPPVEVPASAGADLPLTDAADNIYTPEDLQGLPPEIVEILMPPVNVPAEAGANLPLTDAADNILDPEALQGVPVPPAETPWWVQPQPEVLSGPASVLNPDGTSQLIETPEQAAAAGKVWSDPSDALGSALANAALPQNGMFSQVPSVPDAGATLPPVTPPAEAPDMDAAEAAAPPQMDAAKMLRLGKLLKGLLGKDGDLTRAVRDAYGDEPPEGAPVQGEGQSDEEYVQQLIEYLGIDAETMAAAGLTPGTPEYYQYLMEQLDSILMQLLGDFEGKDLAQLLRGKTAQEIAQLRRALWVRGMLESLMGRGKYADPFTDQEYDVFGPEGMLFNPATGAYHRGLADFIDQLRRMNPDDARAFIAQFLGRQKDLFGMQGKADKRYRQALLEQPEEDEQRKRRGMFSGY